MTPLTHRLASKHGFFVALVSGLVVLAVTLVQASLTTLFAQLTYVSTEGTDQWLWWAGSALHFGTLAVPMAVGVFLMFWFVTPIGPDLRIAQVITRSIFAAAAGGALVLVVYLVTNGFSLVANGLMGQIRITTDEGEQFLQALGYSASMGSGQFLSVAPLVILVGFLVRMWLERHPFEQESVGSLDPA